MRKLNKTQQARLATLRVQYDAAKTRLKERISETNDEIDNLNEKLKQVVTDVQSAVDDLNEAIVEMDSFREEIASEISDYISGRSETWTESDGGQAHQDWHEKWDTSLEEVEIELPDTFEPIEEPEFPDLDDALPAEPSQ